MSDFTPPRWDVNSRRPIEVADAPPEDPGTAALGAEVTLANDQRRVENALTAFQLTGDDTLLRRAAVIRDERLTDPGLDDDDALRQHSMRVRVAAAVERQLDEAEQRRAGIDFTLGAVDAVTRELRRTSGVRNAVLSVDAIMIVVEDASRRFRRAWRSLRGR